MCEDMSDSMIRCAIDRGRSRRNEEVSKRLGKLRSSKLFSLFCVARVIQYKCES